MFHFKCFIDLQNLNQKYQFIWRLGKYLIVTTLMFNHLFFQGNSNIEIRSLNMKVSLKIAAAAMSGKIRDST